MALPSGLRNGRISGTASGQEFAGISTVSFDILGERRWPATLAQWNTLLTEAGSPGAPFLLWNMQEPSGNVADSVGTFTGTASGTPLSYFQPVTGWLRRAILGSDGGTGAFTNTDAGLPDPATESMWILSYVTFTLAPSTIRFVQVDGTGNVTGSRINATPRINGASGVNTLNGAVSPLGVRLVSTIYDVTNNRVVVETDQEKLVITRAATTGKRYVLVPSFPGGFLCSVGFRGSAAERSDAARKVIYQKLNWTIPWT